jgi:hypothetical protein
MKLRIQDNSLRLRLTQTEVARLGDHGSVESAIRFSEARVLRYCLSVSESAEIVSVRYDGDSICVFLPEKIAGQWVKNADVTIEAFDSGVRILVEKDFHCLHQAGDSEPDAYPHPLA